MSLFKQKKRAQTSDLRTPAPGSYSSSKMEEREGEKKDLHMEMDGESYNVSYILALKLDGVIIKPIRQKTSSNTENIRRKKKEHGLTSAHDAGSIPVSKIRITWKSSFDPLVI